MGLYQEATAERFPSERDLTTPEGKLAAAYARLEAVARALERRALWAEAAPGMHVAVVRVSDIRAALAP